MDFLVELIRTLLECAVMVSFAAVGVFLGIKLRKRKDGKNKKD